MKKTAMIFCCVVSLFLFSGCALFSPGDYEKYAETMSTHSTAESQRIQAQAQAISDAVAAADTATPTERTLLAVIGMMQIERLHYTPLDMRAPTTGYDVLNTAVGYLPMGIMGLTTYKIAEVGLASAGSMTVTGETVGITDSFNRIEAHAIGSGNGITVPYNSPTTTTTTTGD